jgi:hypothetical protein
MAEERVAGLDLVPQADQFVPLHQAPLQKKQDRKKRLLCGKRQKNRVVGQLARHPKRNRKLHDELPHQKECLPSLALGCILF